MLQPTFPETRRELPFDRAQETGAEIFAGMHWDHGLTLPASNDQVRTALAHFDAAEALQNLAQPHARSRQRAWR
ncbi:MAG TPA: hypothetical protein VF331_13980 [Polyangiales bacterium]